jgi:RNA-binding protein 8A
MAEKFGSTLSDKNIYTSIEQEEGPGPCKCNKNCFINFNFKFEKNLAVEGYIVFCSGIHEEAQEDQIYDLFSEYGLVKSLHANLDRKTGYLKGYSLIEYENLADAQKAINKLNNSNFLEKQIKVGFAFKKPPEMEKKSRK